MAEHSKVKHVLMAIAIAVITAFFIGYGVTAIYEGPKNEDYCGDYLDRFIEPAPVIKTETACVGAGGTWTNYAQPAFDNSTGYCNVIPTVPKDTCWEEYNEARQPYERNLFVIHVILGLALILGGFFLGVEAVSTGLMGGGILVLIYGTMRYWSELSDVLRTLILGIVLIVLVVFAYRKLK